jgi:leucyl-tRNA synthetase
VDSSWYYLRYLDPNNQLKMFDPSITKLMPADVYIGGIEHAIMHLLYARFVYKFLLKQGMLEKEVGKEPFEQLIVQGLVKGKAVRVRSNGRYLTKEQAKGYKPEELEEVFEKMSKSKFNGVNPTELVEKYGCDALRMAMMFSAPV